MSSKSRMWGSVINPARDQQRNFPSSPRKDQDFWALKSGRKGPRSSLFLRGGATFYLVRVEKLILGTSGAALQAQESPFSAYKMRES